MMIPVKHFLILFSLFLVLLSCNNEPSKKIINKENEIKIGTFSITDSINVNKNGYYTFFNFSNFAKDSIYAFTYPELKVDLLNSKGNLLNNITQRGSGPGEINNFVAFSECDGKLFLLESGNYFRCFIFDKKTFKYIKKIDFKDSELSYFPLFMFSSFDVKKHTENYILTFSTSNYKYGSPDINYYNKGYSVIEYKLDNNLEIVDYKERVPFSSFKEIKTAIEINERSWDVPVVRYVKEGNLTYLYGNFSNSVYVYNENWELVNEVKINLGKNYYKTPFKKIIEPGKRLRDDFKLRFGNNNLYSIDFKDASLFLLFTEKTKVDLIPKDIKELQSFSSDFYLYVIDFKTSKHYKISLPKKFSYYRGIEALNKNEIIIPSSAKYSEDIHLYKVKINY